jgi:hypothetical protein
VIEYPPPRHPLHAALLGALAGFFIGGLAATLLAKQVMTSTDFPAWVHHLLAASVGLATGLPAAVLARGRVMKTLSLILPVVLACAGSWAVFMRNTAPVDLADLAALTAAVSWPDENTWFGTSLALAAAAAGLLAARSSRRLSAMPRGLVGALLGAWLASQAFAALQGGGLPFGYVYPLAFAIAAGLVHFGIASANKNGPHTRAVLQPG